jgi:hypothetical protein
MKKFKLNAVAAIAASVATTGAFAQVNIDATTPAPATVANEIVASAGAPVTLTNTGALSIQSTVGYALSNGEVRYVRVELANGVFKTASATSSNANASIGAINGVGTSVIYFSITAGTGGIAATDTLTIAGNRDITGTASNMTVSYSVYDQPSQAQAGGSTGRIVNKENKAYINFAKSHRLVVTTDSAISDVEASPAFTAFKSGQTSGSTAKVRLAALDYKLAATVPLKADGNAITLGDLMATGSTGTKLVVSGDFSGAANSNGTYTGASLNRVFLSANTNCSTIDLQPAAITAGSASFNVGATATTGNTNLCYEPRQTAPATLTIAASTYTADVNAVSAAAATYAVANTAGGQVGEITRNGTELQAPLFQTTPGYVSRFVLTNNGSADAPFTVSVKGEDGNTITLGSVAGGTVKAGKQLVINASDVAAAFSGSPRGFAVFTVSRPTSQIQGAYQIVNPTTGAVSNTVMVRPGTN